MTVKKEQIYERRLLDLWKKIHGSTFRLEFFVLAGCGQLRAGHTHETHSLSYDFFSLTFFPLFSIFIIIFFAFCQNSVPLTFD